MKLSVVSASMATLLFLSAGCSTFNKMFGKKENMPEAKPVLAFGKNEPGGIVADKTGRLFVCFPRFSEVGTHDADVLEIVNGASFRYVPDKTWNSWRPGADARKAFVSARAMTIDEQNNLWVLDSANPGGKNPVPGAVKLVKFNISQPKAVVEKIFRLPDSVNDGKAYLCALAIDSLNQKAYIADSGSGAIIVFDLVNGNCRTVLEGHPSVSAKKRFTVEAGGNELCRPGGAKINGGVSSLCMSIDGKWLYYAPLASKKLYRIDTSYISNMKLNNTDIVKGIEIMCEPGQICALTKDGEGNIYLSSANNHSIKRIDSYPILDTIYDSKKLEWPDGLAASWDGKTLYITSSQLNRSAEFSKDHNPSFKYPFKLTEFSLEALDQFARKENAASKKK